MRRLLCTAALLALLTVTALPASAQGPTVTVYFDAAHTIRSMDCPGPGLDTLYVVAADFNIFMQAIEFKIDYPPSMTWLADLNTPPVTIGSSPTGISMGFGIPKNAFGSIEVMQALILWNCNDCSSTNEELKVVPHPIFGAVRAVRWPDFVIVNGTGQRSLVCQDVALDIRPRSCPNPFNGQLFEFLDDNQPMKGGVLPVAILGSASFDVTDIDLSSLQLEGVAPLTRGGGPKVEDVAAPVGDNSNCECTSAGPDGFPDLVMKFNAQDIAAAIAPADPGEPNVFLTLTGLLSDGLPFEASDCIRILFKKEQFGPPLTGPVLRPAFPNPFNPVTRIGYGVAEEQHVRLAVYDVTGRLIAVLVNGVKAPGEYVAEWNAGNLASGVYFYRMEVEGETLVRRMTLLK